MNPALLTLELPEDVYDRVRRAAKGMKQPLEKALANIVRAATPSLEQVPVEYRAELEAMEELPDDVLWQEAKCTLTTAQQRQLARLLDKNQRAALTNLEARTLGRLRTAADHLTLRRSYAYLLLKYRGHRIPNLADLRT
jgi:hypothetical protein